MKHKRTMYKRIMVMLLALTSAISILVVNASSLEALSDVVTSLPEADSFSSEVLLYVAPNSDSDMPKLPGDSSGIAVEQASTPELMPGASASEGQKQASSDGEVPQLPEAGPETESGLEPELEHKPGYSLQPQAIEDVLAAIEAYNRQPEADVLADSPVHRPTMPKPRWEFEVPGELMPEGYYCGFVQAEDDLDFGAAYYTFFSMPFAAGSFGFDPLSAEPPGTIDNPYQIDSAVQLAELAELVRTNTMDDNGLPYAGATYILLDDIDLGSYTPWGPIGILNTEVSDTANLSNVSTNNYRPFTGVFNGNGKTIKNLTLSNAYNGSNGYGYTRGLFGLVEGARIYDLTVAGATIQATGQTGVLVGFSVGGTVIENCSVSGVITATSGSRNGVGGLVGFLTVETAGIAVRIINCSTDVAISSSRQNTGGLVGFVRAGHAGNNANNRPVLNSALFVEECTVKGNITSSQENTGGLLGFVHSYYTDAFDLRISNCHIQTGEIKSTSSSGHRVGGLVGRIYADHSDSNQLYIGGCTVDVETIALATSNQNSVAAHDIGGLVGHYYADVSQYNEARVEYCEVKGDRIATTNTGTSDEVGAGGLFGVVRYRNLSSSTTVGAIGFNRLDIENCVISTRDIASYGNHVGGAVGLFWNTLSDDSGLTITNVDVTSDTVRALNAGNVSNRRVGGIIGAYRAFGETGYTDGETPLNDPRNRRTQRPFLEIEGCTVTAAVSEQASDGYEVGGIAGTIYLTFAPESKVAILDCTTRGNVSTSGYNGYRVGGILGFYNSHASAYASFEMTNCEAYGDVTTTGYGAYKVGGVIGEILYSGGYRDTQYGGIQAPTDCVAVISNCHSYASEVSAAGSGTYYVGGLIGVTDVNKFADRTRLLVEECSASADVSSPGYYVGGLIGFCENARPDAARSRSSHASGLNNPNADINADISMYTTIRNCFATGNVTGGAPNPNVASAGTNAGGLIGHCHAGDDLPNDAMTIENCYATGDVTINRTNGQNAGGLVGRPSKNVTIVNSFSTGDVYNAGHYGTGGFIGYAEGDVTGDDHVTVLNCYAIGNVVHTGTADGYGIGGFIGRAQHTFVENSYAIGSVYSARSVPSYVGGFIGWLTYGGRVTNCYATGYVLAPFQNNTRQGGFIGYIDGLSLVAPAYPLYIEDCLYDTTTTRALKGIGYSYTTNPNALHITQNGASVTDVLGLGTTGMIDFTNYEEIFSAWNVENNTCVVPGSSGRGTTLSPWYMDDGITYPYLYYQADGFTQALASSGAKPLHTDPASPGDGWLNGMAVDITARNYFLAKLKSAGVAGGPYEPVTVSRADYTAADLAAENAQYKATSAGAVRGYFPYLFGQSATDFNRYKFLFDGNNEIVLPAGDLYNHTTGALYSFGAISATNIVAFENGPYANKTSNRPAPWVNGDTSTYTYVDKVYEYTVSVANFSTLADWNDVVLTDPLAEGVELNPGAKVMVHYTSQPNAVEASLWNGTGLPPAIPYYTYEEAAPESLYAGRYILKVFLGDFAAMELLPNGEVSYEACMITFDAYVTPAAATVFQPGGSWDGDNIRNAGLVEGAMQYLHTGDIVDIQVPADDRNTDPVYNAFLVIYNDNKDMDFTVSPNDLNEVKQYCSTDGTDSHTVLPNENPNDGGDFVGFEPGNYEFEGWMYFDTDGTTEIHVDIGDVIPNVNREIVLFGKWKKLAPIFELTKTDAAGTPLSGALFEVFLWKGSTPPGANDLVTDKAVEAGEWVSAGTYTSSTSEPMELWFTEPGTNYYQLVELAPPAGYYPLQSQWRFETVIEPPTRTVAYVGRVDPAEAVLTGEIIETAPGEGELKNYQSLELGFLKVSSEYLSSGGEYGQLLAGADFALYYWAGAGTPGAADLVTPDSLLAGTWVELALDTSDSSGKVNFSLPSYDHIYQLVETKAPQEYQLPQGQWRFTVAEGDAIDEVIPTITAVSGPDGSTPPAFKVMTDTDLGGGFGGSLALANFIHTALPAMGGAGVPPALWATGTTLCITGMLFAALLHYKRRRALYARMSTLQKRFDALGYKRNNQNQ